MTQPNDDPRERGESFEGRAAQGDEGLAAEFVAFLVENKRWWLVPIVLTLGLVAFLLFAGSGPLAPFVYTLF
ncbi:MAG: hypothetical protein H6698_09150 [Myxococcales bacterium]|nr:hypothetical protein [Myxococcales bacterium]MCB9534453.1 hypothetical protein [Myxococcales bacterium]